ncbi:hypothetical protein [Agromyces atrinae]|uniref:Uncharacterized protein n=1 Tax=Agromyces atrinae TaxID=592376 RepID=A0A4Q2M9W1_9MICO|nr:hypothetical protein [Agromyces atrinae]NYD67330.1 hypothetical protein [Agromyces atrinae]RXZ86841.1 hypothetical protein ESP50_07200 [Agromyces atrinae]
MTQHDDDRPDADDGSKRPLISGARGGLIYMVTGVVVTYTIGAVFPGSSGIIAIIFIAGIFVAFPWIARRGGGR